MTTYKKASCEVGHSLAEVLQRRPGNTRRCDDAADDVLGLVVYAVERLIIALCEGVDGACDVDDVVLRCVGRTTMSWPRAGEALNGRGSSPRIGTPPSVRERLAENERRPRCFAGAFFLACLHQTNDDQRRVLVSLAAQLALAVRYLYSSSIAMMRSTGSLPLVFAKIRSARFRQRTVRPMTGRFAVVPARRAKFSSETQDGYASDGA
jgi:hypothetical protein